MADSRVINLVDASISELKHALNSGAVTSVELTTRYLHRIAKYDMRGPVLNSIPIINPDALVEAQASDDHRAFGRSPRPLEGIPFTAKDSFRVKGLTVAAGSPAFADLVAPDDAFIVQLLREAGAIVLGKTNMPPMADGGPQRGLYDRAESPYNKLFSTTAYASGSSNGCGTATTASFGAFGLAGETVSSGRAPASNNALVAYSPSRGIIPIRGQWPLYPTCDVVVPHVKSVPDLFEVLNVIVADDPDSRGLDFWRTQTHVPIPLASQVRPSDFHSLGDGASLRGKRIAVPNCFLGIDGFGLTSVCSESVLELFGTAQKELEALGATIVRTGFPAYEQYTKQDFAGQAANVPGLSREWARMERCQLIAMGWDDFLRDMGDPRCPDLTHADPLKIHPWVAPLDDPAAYSEAQNQVRYPEMIDSIRTRGTPAHLLPGCADALKALEAMRKTMFEDWMDENGFDLVAFPTNGDVPLADSDENMESMLDALRDGVKYSNGGRFLKHIGIPCITVPMGEMQDKGMPVGITFATRGWADKELLRYVFAYEAATKRRTSPPLAPSLLTDQICIPAERQAPRAAASGGNFVVKIESAASKPGQSGADVHAQHITVRGKIRLASVEAEITSIVAYVDGEHVEDLAHEGQEWSFSGCVTRAVQYHKYPTSVKLPRDKTMFTVLARASDGSSAADFTLLE